MLKQSELFKIINKNNLSAQQYQIIYRLSSKETISEETKNKIKVLLPEAYIKNNCELTDKSIRMLKAIDDLFKPIKKIKSVDALGPNGDANIEAFLELFPTSKLPNGKYARGNKKNIQENFIWFFQEYQYSWETILNATTRYVNEYQRNNYLYMRTAMFFIKKVIDGTTISELANYCDMENSIEDYAPERFIKTKVV